MGGRANRRRPTYRRFVEEGLLREIQSPWEMIQWQTVFGSESFVRRVQDRMQGKEGDRAEVTGLRQGARPPDALAILKKVSRHYRVAIARLRRRGGYGLAARNVAMWLVWEQCGISLREIGDFFGGLNYAAVARRLRRLTSEDKQQAASCFQNVKKYRCDPHDLDLHLFFVWSAEKIRAFKLSDGRSQPLYIY